MITASLIGKMEKYVVTNCCECGGSFRVIGDGQYFTCPYCGTELSFKPVRNGRLANRAYNYNPELDNPLYYDEDLEGAPGFYGGD